MKTYEVDNHSTVQQQQLQLTKVTEGGVNDPAKLHKHLLKDLS